jgi:hypothetical protein
MAKKPVIPAYAGIQNKNWLLSLLGMAPQWKRPLPHCNRAKAFNSALHGFRQNSIKGFNRAIGPE